MTALPLAATVPPLPTPVQESALNAAAGVERTALITGMGHAFPAGRTQQEYWDGFYGPRIGHNRWARKVFLSAGVSARHTAVDPTTEDISSTSTGERMGRYLEEALPLAAVAASKALQSAGLQASELGLLTVVSCTGYTTPGLDIRLAETLNAEPSLQRLLVGHMGCYAALPAVATASDYVVARGRPALVVCTEIASLHVQPPTDDLEQLVAHAMFSDGAAALILEPDTMRRADTDLTLAPESIAGGRAGLSVVAVASRTDVSTADHMRWDITDLGFRMGLSRRVPDVLARHVVPLVDELLAAGGVRRDEIAGWAVHPGGPRILDVVAERLGLDDDALDASRWVLDHHGNCSSATVLVVLERLLLERLDHQPPSATARYVVALAFGPGLTLYAILLRQHRPEAASII
jgi:predicted naringenin-chalcone synthase